MLKKIESGSSVDKFERLALKSCGSPVKDRDFHSPLPMSRSVSPGRPWSASRLGSRARVSFAGEVETLPESRRNSFRARCVANFQQ